MSMVQGSHRRPANTVAIGAGFSYATDDEALAKVVESLGHSPEVPAKKTGPPRFEAWRQYSLAVKPFAAHHLYRREGPWLDWEMGLGMPFAGTYAPPIGLVGSGSA